MTHSLFLPRTVLFGLAFCCALLGRAADAPAPALPPEPAFHFTVTSDLHNGTATYGGVLDAIQAHSGGPGAFHVSIGDLADKAGQDPQCLREVIDRHCGATAIWWPLIGNHDKRAPSSMAWIRAEHATGNGVRHPLKNLVKRSGPPGCAETTYSWDSSNVHCVALNEYWSGEAAPGSDVATDGRIVPALLQWLDEDLAANRKPFVFVFGHEPAFALFRHVGDSLDKYAAERDAFWEVLKRHHVQAFISGHVHFYYKQAKDGVWQIVDGCAGRTLEHRTYLDIIVGADRAQVNVWQKESLLSKGWKLIDTITLDAAPRQAPAVSASAD